MNRIIRCILRFIGRRNLAVQLDRQNFKSEFSHIHLEKLLFEALFTGLSPEEPAHVLLSSVKNRRRTALLSTGFGKSLVKDGSALQLTTEADAREVSLLAPKRSLVLLQTCS